MIPKNEGKICDAVVRHLEAQRGASRGPLCSPETAGHQFPVDVAGEVAGQLFAIEHTRIEPFPGYLEFITKSERQNVPIMTALSGAFDPADCFQLQVPLGAFHGLKARELAKVQNNLIAWVKDVAPALERRRYGDFKKTLKITPPGVPFSVSLYRFEAAVQPGYFHVITLVPPDLEERRSERMQMACDEKFPKLQGWKTNHGARSILVLEDSDFSFTNDAHVAGAFVPIALARSDRPDETYLMVTAVEPWEFWPILIDDLPYEKIVRENRPSIVRLHDPAQLEDIMRG